MRKAESGAAHLVNDAIAAFCLWGGDVHMEVLQTVAAAMLLLAFAEVLRARQ